MSSMCPYCAGPIRGRGLTGRPWPGQPEPLVYCCYGCLNLGEHRQQSAVSEPSVSSPNFNWTGVRLGLAAVVAGQSMIFGLALNLHDDVPQDVRAAVYGVILGATLFVIVLLGGPLFRAAWHELRSGRLTIEALFILTLSGALAASVQAHVTGQGSIYYEVVSILLVVYTLGKVIGARGRAAALESTRTWASTLATCRIVPKGSFVSHPAPVSSVQPGDVIEIFAGEAIPIDGVIRRGAGFVSEAAVRGEPFPVVKRPGDPVLAGSVSHDATFRVEATTAGTDRQIDQLLAAVDRARDTPLSLQTAADRVATIFLPFVLLTAIATFLGWWLLSGAGWHAALFHAMAVLLVACPCVIGLATPIVVWTIIGRLAECGLVVRSGDAVERLAGVDTVLLDKTGTLTEDRFALVDFVTKGGTDRAWLQDVLANVESQSSHPVARAFADLPRNRGHDELKVIEVRTIPGAGLEAVVEAHGTRQTIRIGKPDWLAPPYRPAAQELRGLEQQLHTPAAHLVAVELNGNLVAIAAVSERLRESTPEALAEFRRLGLPVEVLTGDSAGRARLLELTAVRAGLLPAEKHKRVQELLDQGQRPLMIGDGINDAGALAAAHVGIAMASGTDLAVGSAGATLYHGDLRAIAWAIELSREAIRVARRNMLFAAAYNLVGIGLAAAGLLHPVAAALLMVASNLTLVFASIRVGANPRHCDIPVSLDADDASQVDAVSRIPFRSVVHGTAITLQGPVFAALAGLPFLLAGALTFATAALGLMLADGWRRRPNLSHSSDMVFGMLTLGNLGMLLGWWSDNGLSPIADPECCSCASFDPTRPWMWLGMLLFANLAMLRFGRRPLPSGNHPVAMFTGGNLGMIAGMWAGGMLVGMLPVASISLATAVHFFGMTVGMIGGMLLGTWVFEVLIDAVVGFVAGARPVGVRVRQTMK